MSSFPSYWSPSPITRMPKSEIRFVISKIVRLSWASSACIFVSSWTCSSISSSVRMKVKGISFWTDLRRWLSTWGQPGLKLNYYPNAGSRYWRLEWPCISQLIMSIWIAQSQVRRETDVGGIYLWQTHSIHSTVSQEFFDLLHSEPVGLGGQRCWCPDIGHSESRHPRLSSWLRWYIEILEDVKQWKQFNNFSFSCREVSKPVGDHKPVAEIEAWSSESICPDILTSRHASMESQVELVGEANH